VVREFTTRTHYRILNEAGEAADVTLRGTVNFHRGVAPHLQLLNRSSRQRFGGGEHEGFAHRPSGQGALQNPSYLFREQYEVSQDLASFFEEDSPAYRRLSQDFARTLVSNILEGF